MLLDLRFPMGLFFSALGVLIAGYGLLGDKAVYRVSLGILLFGVLMLAAPKDTRILIRAVGLDAEEAIAAIGELIARKFGEE